MVLPWLLVILLLVFNGTTVLNERVNNAAYGVIAAIVGILGESVSQDILSRSPAYIRTKAVGRATVELRARNTELSAKHIALETEHTRLQANRVALAKEYDALRTSSMKRAVAVNNLAVRATTKLAVRTAEAVTSLPIRAVPYLGIAALVTFTTLEVNADCELARSLADLNVQHGNDPIDVGKICSYVGKVPSVDDAWNQAKSQASGVVKGAYGIIERSASRKSASL